MISLLIDKNLRNLVKALAGTSGNADTRLEVYAVSGGAFAYGGYPEIDGLFRQQSTRSTGPGARPRSVAFVGASRSARAQDEIAAITGG